MAGAERFTGWLAGQLSILTKGMLVLKSAPALLRSLEQVWQLARGGGLLICTPEVGAPLLATVIQADGDILVSVCSKLLEPDHVGDRQRLLDQHRARVGAAIAPLRSLVEQGRALDGLAMMLRRYALGVSALSGGASTFDWVSLEHVAFWAAPPLALSAFGAAAGPVVRWFIRRKMSKLTSQVRRELSSRKNRT